MLKNIQNECDASRTENAIAPSRKLVYLGAAVFTGFYTDRPAGRR